MKKNNLQEARSKNPEELKKDLAQAKKQLAKTRLEIISGKAKNARGAKILRKDIAQLETLLREKAEGSL